MDLLEESTRALLHGLSKAGTSALQSDVTIVCKGQSFFVHRLVLCLWSDVFQAMFRSGMIESLSNRIDLSKGHDPAIIKRMTHYLYNLDYDGVWNDEEVWCDESHEGDEDFSFDGSPIQTKEMRIVEKGIQDPNNHNVHDDMPLVSHLELFDDDYSIRRMKDRQENRMFIRRVEELIKHGARDGESEFANELKEEHKPFSTHPSLIVNAQMWMCADKYNIPTLQALALSKLKDQISQHWNSVEFSLCISYIYRSAAIINWPLRDLVIEAARVNIRALEDRGDFLAMQLGEPEFMRELLWSVVQDPPTS